jgi:pyrroline-5-carboxylate reductase
VKVLSLGAGNMVSALMGPIVSEFESFNAYSPGSSASVFCERFGATKIESLDECPQDLDVLLLSFKPQVFNEATAAFLKSKTNLEGTLIVSMLAGTPLEVLERTFKTSHVVRIMPNTPAMVGHGVSLFLSHPEALLPSVQVFKSILMKTGKVIEADSESQFDQWTAITGSGPAYLFEVARVLEKILVGQRMDAVDAHEAVGQLFLGSSLLMTKETDSYEQLRQKVTSKKGVTFEALEILSAQGLEDIFNKAIEANIARSVELKKLALSKE